MRRLRIILDILYLLLKFEQLYRIHVVRYASYMLFERSCKATTRNLSFHSTTLYYAVTCRSPDRCVGNKFSNYQVTLERTSPLLNFTWLITRMLSGDGNVLHLVRNNSFIIAWTKKYTRWWRKLLHESRVALINWIQNWGIAKISHSPVASLGSRPPCVLSGTTYHFLVIANLLKTYLRKSWILHL